MVPCREKSEWERERLSLSAFLGTRGHRGPYSPYKPCNHNLYIGIIIFPEFPHWDNPQINVRTGYNQPKKDWVNFNGLSRPADSENHVILTCTMESLRAFISLWTNRWPSQRPDRADHTWTWARVKIRNHNPDLTIILEWAKWGNYCIVRTRS